MIHVYEADHKRKVQFDAVCVYVHIKVTRNLIVQTIGERMAIYMFVQ